MSHDSLWARPNRRLELEIIHYGVAEFEQDLETLETQPGGAGNPKAEIRKPKSAGGVKFFRERRFLSSGPISRPQANAECRMQNAERPDEAKATPMRHQCDIQATSMRVASQAVATSKPPSCDPQATFMRPSSHPKVTTKPGRRDVPVTV